MGDSDKPRFRGHTIHRLDAKGRLRIPTKFRDILHNHYTDVLVITQMGECLVAYPSEIWDKIETKALELSQVQQEHRDFMRYFVSTAEECGLDNQGRVLISPLFREKAGLDQDILLVGMLTNFEIWNKSRWDKRMDWTPERHQKVMEVTAAATGI